MQLSPQPSHQLHKKLILCKIIISESEMTFNWRRHGIRIDITETNTEDDLEGSEWRGPEHERRTRATIEEDPEWWRFWWPQFSCIGVPKDGENKLRCFNPDVNNMDRERVWLQEPYKPPVEKTCFRRIAPEVLLDRRAWHSVRPDADFNWRSEGLTIISHTRTDELDPNWWKIFWVNFPCFRNDAGFLVCLNPNTMSFPTDKPKIWRRMDPERLDTRNSWDTPRHAPK